MLSIEGWVVTMYWWFNKEEVDYGCKVEVVNFWCMYYFILNFKFSSGSIVMVVVVVIYIYIFILFLSILLIHMNIINFYEIYLH